MPTEQKTNDEESIEEETGNEEVKSEIPFDPNEINISIVPRTIGQLVDMLEYDEILVPKFQRLPNLWGLKQKSRFIESLMLKLPIPLFYFSEADDNKWHVIDGLQRISTLEHFILGDIKKNETISNKKESFKLENLEFRTEYNNKKWHDLPKDIQRRINTNQVTINLIGKGTPEEVKYNIFSRINQGGIQLTPQEIRTALFQGFRIEFIESLVSKDSKQGKAFIKATDGSVPFRRQEDLDFATRFIAFYLLDYKKYEPDMDTFMTKATKAIPSVKSEQNKIIEDFENSMELAYDIFETDAFRKPAENKRRKPINKSLFEVISVHFAHLSNMEREAIKNNKSLFIKQYSQLFTYDNKEQAYFFIDSISTGTAAKENVRKRHESFEELINQFKK
jgi:hypothetical protein